MRFPLYWLVESLWDGLLGRFYEGFQFLKKMKIQQKNWTISKMCPKLALILASVLWKQCYSDIWYEKITKICSKSKKLRFSWNFRFFKFLLNFNFAKTENLHETTSKSTPEALDGPVRSRQPRRSQKWRLEVPETLFRPSLGPISIHIFQRVGGRGRSP